MTRFALKSCYDYRMILDKVGTECWIEAMLGQSRAMSLCPALITRTAHGFCSNVFNVHVHFQQESCLRPLRA